jgi:hypothetical protein
MTLIRYRKRIQIDIDNNLYIRNPENALEFIIIGNLAGPGEITAPYPLTETIRYRKAVRIDTNQDLYIRVGNDFVLVGNAAGTLDNTINDYVENDYVEDYFE